MRPQLNMFKGPGWDGSWTNVGTGARGETLVDLVVYLSGGAPRRACADWLGALVDRFAEVEVR